MKFFSLQSSYMMIITHIAVIFTLNAVEYNSHGNAGLHLYHLSVIEFKDIIVVICKVPPTKLGVLGTISKVRMKTTVHKGGKEQRTKLVCSPKLVFNRILTSPSFGFTSTQAFTCSSRSALSE